MQIDANCSFIRREFELVLSEIFCNIKYAYKPNRNVALLIRIILYIQGFIKA